MQVKDKTKTVAPSLRMPVVEQQYLEIGLLNLHYDL